MDTHIGSRNKDSGTLTKECHKAGHQSSLSIGRFSQQVNPRGVKCSVELELRPHLEELLPYIFLVLICRIIVERADYLPRFFGPSLKQ